MEHNQKGLKSSFTPLGIWAISIGTSIGWGSFIVTCNTYLQKSGLLGTVFGLLIGMAVIFVITWNLQYMIQRSPDAGGIYSYVRKISGRDLGFLAFWLILLTYMAILWANITSVPLFARFFMGNTFQFGFHYRVFDYEVWMGEGLLSMCMVVIIGLLCSRRARLPGRIVTLSALVFSVGFAVCALYAIFRHDHSFSYEPMYTEGSNAFAQIVRIAAISPWAFIGFENIAHFSEEYTFPIRKVRRILIWSVALTTVLYLLVSVLSVSAYPQEYGSWLEYIQNMGELEGIKAVPAFYAAHYYLGQGGVTVLMLSLFAVILTSLICNMMALSRLLYAAGKQGEAPCRLARLNRNRVPGYAVCIITAISFFVPLIGRTAIGWIVDVTTLGATLMYGLISFAVYKDAKESHDTLERNTGIIGIVLMVCFVLLLLIPGLLPFDAMETESYVLFIAWALLGIVYFSRVLRRNPQQDDNGGQHIIVWAMLLMLVLFASMMWVSRSTENAADEAVQRIYDYHQIHSGSDADPVSVEEREHFLQEQADQITGTNTLYSVVSLGLFLIFLVIMLHNYQDFQRLGRRLSLAEEEAESARKIAELKESITSLMDNMPAMSFSKDAVTGVYLACNQAFADYAHKDSPEGVAGLTDFEIFDPETAAHFKADDQFALESDRPYIFFEDVADAIGNRRQFETTKLKFFDTNGRLCLLGMSMDVTEMERTKAAYQKALNTSEVYENMVGALSGDYFNLFYIDVESGEYTEYGLRTVMGHSATETHGTDFFGSIRKNARNLVYEEDRNRFVSSLEKETLLEEIRRNGMYIMQYRLMIEGKPNYVNLKATLIEGTEEGEAHHLIIGVNNVDAQVKDRILAQRAKEEKAAYLRLNALNSNLIVLYFVDIETEHYKEFGASKSFEELGLEKQGEEFFKTTYKNSLNTVHPEDQQLFHSQISKENILHTIRRDGIFVMDYRFMNGDLPTYVRMKAARIEENGKPMLIIGLFDEDAQIRQEQAFVHDLSVAKKMATIDALTGVKNKYAYTQWEERIDAQIGRGEQEPFAVVVCDINNMKEVNDRYGHKEGDECIRRNCKRICDIFDHSPVFRVGGDEFVVLLKGEDYRRREELMEEINSIPQDPSGVEVGDIISAGMVEYRKDAHFSMLSVFEEADMAMYQRKQALKKAYKHDD